MLSEIIYARKTSLAEVLEHAAKVSGSWVDCLTMIHIATMALTSKQTSKESAKVSSGMLRISQFQHFLN